MASQLLLRREAAKTIKDRLNDGRISAAFLRNLEVDGVIEPVRDDKNRPRYTNETIDQATPVIRRRLDELDGRTAAPLRPQFAPPPPPEMQPVGQDNGADWESDVAHLNETLFAILDSEATAYGIDRETLLDTWAANGSAPIPTAAFPILEDFGQQYGYEAAELWSVFLEKTSSPPQSNVVPFTRPAPEFRPPASVPTQASVSRPRYQPRRSSQRKYNRGYSRQQTAPHPAYQYPTFPMPNPQPDPVSEARQAVEIQRLDQERRRLEFQAGQEQAQWAAQQWVEHQQAAQMAQAQWAAQAQAAAQAEQERQRVAWQRRQQQQEARSDGYRQMREDAEQQSAQFEARRIARQVSEAVASLPDTMTPAQVEEIRTQAFEIIQDQPDDAGMVLVRDLVTRAATQARQTIGLYTQAPSNTEPTEEVTAERIEQILGAQRAGDELRVASLLAGEGSSDPHGEAVSILDEAYALATDQLLDVAPQIDGAEFDSSVREFATQAIDGLLVEREIEGEEEEEEEEEESEYEA